MGALNCDEQRALRMNSILELYLTKLIYFFSSSTLFFNYIFKPNTIKMHPYLIEF